MPELQAVFATPLANMQYAKAAWQNQRLRALFLARETEGQKYENLDRYTLRNEALFESTFNLFEWQDPAVAELANFCVGQVYQLIGHLNNYDVETLRRLHASIESWFHITRRNGYFGVHNHPLYAWSGVYCVCQEGDGQESNSCCLTFLNPNSTMYMDLSMFRLSGAFQIGHLSLRIKPG